MTEYKRFYADSIISQLSVDVSKAEADRQKGSHIEVEDAFNKWFNRTIDGTELSVLEERATRGGLEEEVDLVKAGLAGLGRIRHVDINSQLKTSSGRGRERILQGINEIDRLYQRLVVDSLPPFSIHGGSMCWFVEIAQDKANTEIILGNPVNADAILQGAIHRAGQICRELKPKVDSIMGQEILKDKNYSLFREVKAYLGALSALGVAKARRARKDGDLVALLEGTAHVAEAHRFEPNAHRLATLSFWLMGASANLQFRGNPLIRFAGLVYGGITVMQAAAVDSNATISALRQMMIESEKLSK